MHRAAVYQPLWRIREWVYKLCVQVGRCIGQQRQCVCWLGVAVVGVALHHVWQGSFQVVGPHSTWVAVELLCATLGDVLVETCPGTSGLRPFGVVC